MTQVILRQDANLTPVGSRILDSFRNQLAWIAERQWSVEVVPDQDGVFIYSKWTFADPRQAVMFKLTWGGNW